VCSKILNAEFKGDKYFVDEVEIHYSKNKASNKAVTLTYP